MSNGRAYPPPEKDVLSAYFSYLKKMGEGEFEVSRRPDVEDRTSRAYDFECTERNSGQRIAIELSSAWRRDEAGREDHEWSTWCAQVNKLLSPTLRGTYHGMTSIAVPRRIQPEAAVVAIRKILPDVDREPRGRSIRIEIEGFAIAVSRFATSGATIEFARFGPNDPMPEFRDFLIEIVKSKDEQLAKAKAAGLPTHLVIYNTCWPLFNDGMLKGVANAIPAGLCANVDKFVVIHGNVPDDCWCIPLELPRVAR